MATNSGVDRYTFRHVPTVCYYAAAVKFLLTADLTPTSGNLNRLHLCTVVNVSVDCHLAIFCAILGIHCVKDVSAFLRIEN